MDVCHRAGADVGGVEVGSPSPVLGIELRSLRLMASALTHEWSQLGPYSGFSFSVDTAIYRSEVMPWEGSWKQAWRAPPLLHFTLAQVRATGFAQFSDGDVSLTPWQQQLTVKAWRLCYRVLDFFYSFNTVLFIVRVDLSIYYKLLFNSLLQSLLFWDYRCVTLCPAGKLVLHTLFRTCPSWIPQWLF